MKKKAAERTKKAQKRFYGKGMASESMSLLDRIDDEINEGLVRTTPVFGGVTPLSDPGTLGYARDTSTAPRMTVKFGAPIMPYLDNLSLFQNGVGLSGSSRVREDHPAHRRPARVIA